MECQECVFRSRAARRADAACARVASLYASNSVLSVRTPVAVIGTVSNTIVDSRVWLS